ncbi:hypothetical protein [Alkalihalobacterium bogoriense]|uniref:hypothetical protein n=1 Tax=Alkalihalobacterium bogoriense TaxID=246272 RepID=UPI00047B66B2|nr:hypothetical protein [Alkalihalobacterium bogoriense]
MNHDMILVIAGIALFFFTGLLGMAGIYCLMKQQMKKGIVFFSIGFICIIIFIVLFFALF